MESSGIKPDTLLGSLSGKMAGFLVSSRSDNTSKKYFAGFNRWKSFINTHGFSELPADPIHVALFLTYLIDKHLSHCVVESAYYSIKWAHQLNGYVDPTDNSFVKSLLESSKRINGKPVHKKDPVNSQMLIDLCNMFENSKDLMVIRDLTMILFGYAGFLRFDELSSLCFRDVKIFEDHISIFIANSKTDQYRQGNEILVSKGSSTACPVNMYKRYLSLSGFNSDSDHFIFKPIFKSKGVAKLIYKNKKLSYTAARENVVKRLKSVAPNLNLGLHSLRSGGASAAAKSHVNERCLKRHGRWKSDLSKDGYIEDSFDNRMSVSQNLGL